MRGQWRIRALALASALLPGAAGHAGEPTPAFHDWGFREQRLDLPGMPAAVIPADINGDGRDDLVVLVAYTAWGDVATTEQLEFDDIEGLVEVMNVVTALIDRRELRVYPARSDGTGFEPHLPPLDLDTSVHALSAAPHGATLPRTAPLLALTDEGIAAVRIDGESEAARLVLEPLLTVESTLTGTGTFYAEFDFLRDLDGDGSADLLLPIESGGAEDGGGPSWAIFRGTGDGFGQAPSAVLTVPPKPPDPVDRPGAPEETRDGDGDAGTGAGDPGDSDRAGDRGDDDRGDGDPGEDSSGGDGSGGDEPTARAPRQPRVEDLDADGRPDLVVFKVDRGRDPIVFLNRGSLTFAGPVEVSLDHPAEGEEIVFIGDLEGWGLASIVSAQELEPPDDAGYKLHVEHAKEPDFAYRVYPLNGALRPAGEPARTFSAEGYTFEGADEDNGDDEDVDVRLPGGFQDLDGDGRQDLVAITLDFSLVPLVFRALVLGSISLRMDFHPHCRDADGSFSRVPELDLSGKFKINFRKVRLKHLSQFEGDFNGDGRADFVQLGRGRKVTIHQGGPGCVYPVEPDRTIHLANEPKHLGLVRILDLDGNGRSDLYVVHPRKDPKSGETAPVRLDLYLGTTAGGR